jgi:hypothetical protein
MDDLFFEKWTFEWMIIFRLQTKKLPCGFKKYAIVESIF